MKCFRYRDIHIRDIRHSLRLLLNINFVKSNSFLNLNMNENTMKLATLPNTYPFDTIKCTFFVRKPASNCSWKNFAECFLGTFLTIQQRHELTRPSVLFIPITVQKKVRKFYLAFLRQLTESNL